MSNRQISNHRIKNRKTYRFTVKPDRLTPRISTVGICVHDGSWHALYCVCVVSGVMEVETTRSVWWTDGWVPGEEWGEWGGRGGGGGAFPSSPKQEQDSFLTPLAIFSLECQRSRVALYPPSLTLFLSPAHTPSPVVHRPPFMSSFKTRMSFDGYRLPPRLPWTHF